MKTVIIVEDDTDIAELQAAILRGYASVQIISDNFERTLQLETWDGVDVAVIDLMLPGVQGEVICQFLKAVRPDIRRVICTAKPIAQIRKLYTLADVVLQKPFDPQTFLGAVMGHS